MRIGITGNKGFIGRSIADALRLGGHEVIPLDRFTFQGLASEAEQALWPRNLDWVLHFGALTSVPLSFEEPFKVYGNNLGSTLVALQIAHMSRAPFLFMSSYVYGQPRYLPIDESHPVSASNPYMGSKILGEMLCRQMSTWMSLPLLILRGFQIYGGHFMTGRLISDLLQAARSGEAFVLKDPTPKRDYLYIKDFVALMLRIVSQDPLVTGTFNVGSGQSFSNLEVAEIVIRLSNRSFPMEIQHLPRKNEISDCYADIGLVKRVFQWEPLYSLEAGLREILIP